MTKISDRAARVIRDIEALDTQVVEAAQKKLDNLTKPLGSLGRLEELAKAYAGITKNMNPALKNKVIFTFAADHGVAEEGVSAYPQEVTAQMVYNFLRQGAGINVLAGHSGVRVVVADLGVAVKIQAAENKNFRDRKINYGTKNFVKGSAMTRQEAIKSIETGIELAQDEIAQGADILGTGDMGIANTTSSSAIAACLLNKSIEEITDRGTGVDDARLKNKIRVVKEALRVNNPDSFDPVDVLAKVGGFEIGGLCGVILAGASGKIPVVIDGFISGAAALLAFALEPKVKDYLIASHCSVEKGHKIILDHIGLKPLLDLGLRLGEGTGAALGISLVDAALKIFTRMATFNEAGVSNSG